MQDGKIEVIKFLEDENWKDAVFPGLEPGKYEVSDNGNVTIKATGRPVKTNLAGNYISFSTKVNGKNCNLGIHRVVNYSFNEPYPDPTYVTDHINSNTLHNNADNLQWLTNRENIRKGNVNRGRVHFTDEQVHTICQMLIDGYKYSEILDKIGVEDNKHSRVIITHIKRGESYSHISSQYNLSEKAPVRGMSFITKDQVRRICDLLQMNKSAVDISNDPILLGMVGDAMNKDQLRSKINDIRARRSHIDVSDNYTFWTEEFKASHDNPLHKFTNQQVHDICKMIDESGHTRKEIARAVGIDITVDNLNIINAINAGRYRGDIACKYKFFANGGKPLEKGTYKEADARRVCEILQSGVTKPMDVCRLAGLEYNKSSRMFVTNIRKREIRTNISKDYVW